MFFDYNATSPLRPAVKRIISDHLDAFGNPSSIHKYGRDVRAKIEEARDKIAAYLSVSSKHIIFTSGATESNACALNSHKGPLIISAIEHDSLYIDISNGRKDAFELSVTKDGTVDLVHLEKLLQQTGKNTLVTIMAANNETGAIQPIHDVSELCKRHHALLHIDAVQTFGKIDFDYCGATSLSLSGHKIGALSGVGVLVKSEKFSPLPLIRGGGQERSFRSGTENILGIMALGAAIDSVKEDESSHIQKLRDKFEAEIIALCPTTQIFAKHAPRLPNTSNLTMPDVKSALQLINFDLRNIAVSTGSACSSGKVKISRVLQKMGVDENDASTAIRVSFGFASKTDECDKLIDAWKAIYQKLSPSYEQKRIYHA